MMRRISLLIVLTITALAAAGGTAHAATCNFTGAAGGSWATAGNWDCGTNPGSTDIAVLDSTDSVAVSADAAAASLTLNGGTITLSASATLTVAGTNVGTLGIQSGTITGVGTLVLGANGTFTKTTAGRLSLLDGAQLTLGGLTGSVSGGDICLNDIANGPDPHLSINKLLTLASSAPAAVFPCSTNLGPGAISIGAGTGQLSRSGNGSIDITTPITIAGSLIALSGQTIRLLSPWTQTAGFVSIASGAILGGTVGGTISGGTTAIDGVTTQPLTVSGIGAVLSGAGTINAGVSVTTGTLSPGGGASGGNTGQLTINGSYTQATVGTTLDIQVKGASPGSSYDVLAVNGAANVGGTLKVTTPLFSPAPTDEFRFLTATAFGGSFATLDAPPSPAYLVDYPTNIGPLGARLLLQAPYMWLNSSLPLVAAPGGGIVGTGLTCSTGTWEFPVGTPGNPPLSYAWLRDGVLISGQNASIHVLTVADALHKVGCRVTATGTGGPTSAIASPYTIPGTVPSNVTKPTAAIGASVGDASTCTLGTWTAAPEATFEIHWLRDGRVIDGADGDTYRIVIGDVGSEISCLVNATNNVGLGSAVSNSLLIKPVLPVNARVPAINGNAPLGSTLTCDRGEWSGVPTPALAIQWLRGTEPIAGETQPDYQLKSIDGNKDIVCQVTATNSAGATTATSAALRAGKNPEQRLAALSKSKRADAIGLPSATGCVKRKRFPFTLAAPKGVTIKLLKLTVNSRRQSKKQVGSKFIAAVGKASMSRRKVFTIGVVITTSTGKKITANRKYKICR